MKKFTYLLLLVATFTMSSFATKADNIVNIVVNSEDHTILETAVVAAELAGALSAEGPFTVFAPTDAAFGEIPSETLDALLADPTGDLADILKYHVVQGKALSTDLSDGDFITTLNGDSLKVTIDGENVYIQNAMVTAANLEAGNGVVHVIDKVLMPYPATVVEIVVNSEDHETLEAAVIAAELADDLSTEGPFTVFAPTDAAFAEIPSETLNALLADPTGDLADILKYHVVAGKALSTDLSDGDFITTLNGDSLKVTIDGGNVYINDAMVTAADIMADNGVVHVINKVLIPDQTTTSVTNLNESEIKLYPNPANDYINIDLPSVSGNISIVNITGKTILKKDIRSSVERIDLSDLNSGIYLVRIQDGPAVLTKKLIIR